MGFWETVLAVFVGTSLALWFVGANRVLNKIYDRFDALDGHLRELQASVDSKSEELATRLGERLQHSEWRIRKEVNPALAIFDGDSFTPCSPP